MWVEGEEGRGEEWGTRGFEGRGQGWRLARCQSEEPGRQVRWRSGGGVKGVEGVEGVVV